MHAEPHFGTVHEPLHSGAVGYVSGLLAALPEGDFELYCHSFVDSPRHELEALVSPRIKAQVVERGIRLVRYQDL